MQRTDHVPESDRGEGRTAKDSDDVRTEPATRDTSPAGADQTGRTEPVLTEPPGPPVTVRAGTREADVSTHAETSPSDATTTDATTDDAKAAATPEATPPEIRTGDESGGSASTTAEDAEPTPRRSPRHSEHVLDPALSNKYQERWREVQAGFVDDPAGAVRSADDLVMEVTSALSEAVSQRREALGTHTGDGTTETEELRTTLRSYREVVQRLLEI